MTIVKRSLFLAVMLTAMAFVGMAANASAATSATCTYSGTYDEVADSGSAKFTCSNPDGSCTGTLTFSGGKASGTCTGRTAFGKISCSINGSYSVNTSTNTATVNGTYSCRVGIISCSGTQSGSGTYDARGRFKGTSSGSC